MTKISTEIKTTGLIETLIRNENSKSVKSKEDFMRLSLIFLVMFTFLIASSAFAQNHIRITLHQPPPNQLRATDIWKLIIFNPTQSTLEITLYGTLEEAREGMVIEGNSKSIKLVPGRKTITYDDVKSGNVNFSSGKWREAFMRTGNAPSGNYTICITVKDISGEVLGSNCIEQRVEILSPPTLVSPANEETIDEKQQLIFTWMPPMPTPQGVNYKIKIVEIIGNQSPEDAMLRNKAFFEKEDIRSTMFQYPLSSRKIEAGKKYAWAVQFINNSGQGIGELSKRSEIFIFESLRKHDPQPTDSTENKFKKFDPQPTDSVVQKFKTQPSDSVMRSIIQSSDSIVQRPKTQPSDSVMQRSKIQPSDSIVRAERYDLTTELPNDTIEIPYNILNIQFVNNYSPVDGIMQSIYDFENNELVKPTNEEENKQIVSDKGNKQINSNGLNRISINIKDYSLTPGTVYLLVVSDFKTNHYLKFKVTNDREK
jgi:hypothetical protein